MSNLSFIELWTTSNSPFIKIDNTYTELKIPTNTENLKTDDWIINQNEYPQLIYKGESRKFMLIATISVSSNRNYDDFIFSFSVNDNILNKEKVSSVPISGKPEEITLSSTLTINKNDIISIYCKSYSPTNGFSRLNLVRLDFIIYSLGGNRGERGLDGIPGSGSSLIIKKNNNNISNTPHSAINFNGDYIIVKDNGSSVDVTFEDNKYGKNKFHISDNKTTFTTLTWKKKLNLTTDMLPYGNYKISWYAEISNSVNELMQVKLNHNNEILAGPIFNSQSIEYYRAQIWQTFTGFKYLTISGINNFDIFFGLPELKNGVAQIKNVCIELIRV